MTDELRPGDKVVMNDNYYVSEENKGKIFTVRSEPWNVCGTDVVKISGKSGGYAVDGLTKVEDGGEKTQDDRRTGRTEGK